MRSRTRDRLLCLGLLVGAGLTFGVVLVHTSACKSEFTAGGDGPFFTEAGVAIWPEMRVVGPCQPGTDQDMDKIPDEIDGCDTDSDGDKIPNYGDSDSDNDRVGDRFEAGPDPSHPVDSDGDGKPDFQDNDSDNDGVDDGDEDLNGDGLLGCCVVKCGEQRSGCTLEADGCVKPQKCVNGTCQPAADFLCSNGESDPKKKVTFGTKPDTQLPTFVCQKPDEVGDKGLKPMAFKTSNNGKWKLALEMSSTYGEVAVTGGAALEAGATFDLTGADQGVAGFIVSMPAPGADVSAIVTTLIGKLKVAGAIPGVSSVIQLSSGTPTTSHDKYATVLGTELSLTMSSGANPPTVRNALFKALLGKGVTMLPQANFGSSSTSLRLRMQTLLRKDNRVLVMGAVADAAMMNDTSKATGIHVEDLSNGTGLATDSDSDTVECDPFVLSGNPVADIIWVIDESGSMSANRQDVANNAVDFFARALKSGLDFRIAVTGVNTNQNGKFCSSTSTTSTDPGGVDRFLLPTEQTIFSACAINPPGYEGSSEYTMKNARLAVQNHLPRAANNPAKIRPGAQIVLVIATDENDQEWEGKYGSGYTKTCVLPAATQTLTMAMIQPDIDLYTGKSSYGAEAHAIVHLIGGVCNNACNEEISHPWFEVVKATKGIMADICQKNLGATLQIMIDTIAGAASPAVLQYVPISASLAVAVDQTQLKRSRAQGFDYVSSSNTLVFIGVPFPTGSQVVASYRRWVKQASLE